MFARCALTSFYICHLSWDQKARCTTYIYIDAGVLNSLKELAFLAIIARKESVKHHLPWLFVGLLIYIYLSIYLSVYLCACGILLPQGPTADSESTCKPNHLNTRYT